MTPTVVIAARASIDLADIAEDAAEKKGLSVSGYVRYALARQAGIPEAKALTYAAEDGRRARRTRASARASRAA